ncbi:MAG: hypothetical protein WA709_06770 [Stellaceae bacterium]
MTGSSKSQPLVRFRRAAWVARLVLAATLVPLASAAAAAGSTLQVEAATGLPGFHRGDLQRYLALHMAEAGLGQWRFEPAADSGSARDRVEWTFKLNPYAGGEVRNFVHTLVYERQLGEHRPITIEARLYLNGEYQTLVEQQAIIHGGPDDPELAAAVASATQNLLGPSGAYRAIDLGLRRGHL